jgi:hypothetical protein
MGWFWNRKAAVTAEQMNPRQPRWLATAQEVELSTLFTTEVTAFGGVANTYVRYVGSCVVADKTPLSMLEFCHELENFKTDSPEMPSIEQSSGPKRRELSAQEHARVLVEWLQAECHGKYVLAEAVELQIYPALARHHDWEIRSWRGKKGIGRYLNELLPGAYRRVWIAGRERNRWHFLVPASHGDHATVAAQAA